MSHWKNRQATPPPALGHLLLPIREPYRDDGFGWFFDEDAGGFVINFGKHRGKKLAEVELSYLAWCEREFDPSPRNRALLDAIEKYRTGLEEYADTHYAEFVIPFGNTYRGKTIRECHDKPWMQWTMGQSWLRKKYPLYFRAVKNWLANPRKQGVKRDIGELLSVTRYTDDLNLRAEKEGEEEECSDSEGPSLDGFIVLDDEEQDEDEDARGQLSVNNKGHGGDLLEAAEIISIHSTDSEAGSSLNDGRKSQNEDSDDEKDSIPLPRTLQKKSIGKLRKVESSKKKSKRKRDDDDDGFIVSDDASDESGSYADSESDYSEVFETPRKTRSRVRKGGASSRKKGKPSPGKGGSQSTPRRTFEKLLAKEIASKEKSDRPAPNPSTINRRKSRIIISEQNSDATGDISSDDSLPPEVGVSLTRKAYSKKYKTPASQFDDTPARIAATSVTSSAPVVPVTPNSSLKRRMRIENSSDEVEVVSPLAKRRRRDTDVEDTLTKGSRISVTPRSKKRRVLGKICPIKRNPL